MTGVTNEEVLIAVRELAMIIKARFDGAVASDFDIDSTHGNPKVRFDAKTWRGPSCKGKKLADCPAAFLDHYAHALASIADKEDAERKMYKGRPASRYTRQDAARARGWALRKRLRGEEEMPAAADAKPAAPTFNGAGPNAFGGGSTAFGGGGAAPAPTTSGGDDLLSDDDLDEDSAEENDDDPL